jgi:hypothetical protein
MIELPIEAPFVAVVWDDAKGNANIEYTVEEVSQHHHATPYVTFGFMMLENEEGITLFSEQCLDSQGLRGMSFIPAGMAKEIIRGEALGKLLGLGKVRKTKQPAKPLEDSL